MPCGPKVPTPDRRGVGRSQAGCPDFAALNLEAGEVQATEHIHTVKVPFELELGQGKTLDRFVFVYLIYTAKICLIDCGVSGSKDLILDYVRETGHDPGEIALTVITHAHPDHIGGALGVQQSVGCKIAAHSDDVTWIEDVNLQYRERPIPGFDSIVEGPVKVEVRLKDGDRIDPGDGTTLRVIHTPGHSKGHISLFYEEDRALISGDCIPLPGEIPIYEDVISSMRSLKKVREIIGLEALLSSWDEPRYGDRIYEIVDAGMHYIEHVHTEVLKARAALGSSDATIVGTEVCKNLGLPEIALNPVYFKSIEAHLRASKYEDLVGLQQIEVPDG